MLVGASLILFLLYFARGPPLRAIPSARAAGIWPDHGGCSPRSAEALATLAGLEALTPTLGVGPSREAAAVPGAGAGEACPAIGTHRAWSESEGTPTEGAVMGEADGRPLQSGGGVSFSSPVLTDVRRMGTDERRVGDELGGW